MKPAFPKPSAFREKRAAVNTYRDGREVVNMLTKAGRDEYQRRKEVMHARQNGLCSICGKYVRKDEMTFEHEDGRGHGGGHRDDRIEKDGKPYNSVAHPLCNLKKGSKRLSQMEELVP